MAIRAGGQLTFMAPISLAGRCNLRPPATSFAGLFFVVFFFLPRFFLSRNPFFMVADGAVRRSGGADLGLLLLRASRGLLLPGLRRPATHTRSAGPVSSRIHPSSRTSFSVVFNQHKNLVGCKRFVCLPRQPRLLLSLL